MWRHSKLMHFNFPYNTLLCTEIIVCKCKACNLIIVELWCVVYVRFYWETKHVTICVCCL
jgi:hypothetical protein